MGRRWYSGAVAWPVVTSFPRPWVIAHRGASAAARPNTLEAFRRAEEMGADAVELDVRRTADDRVVVHHDASLRTAGPIVALRFAEVRRASPSVPALADALEACGSLWVNVEIKNSPVDPDWDPDDRILQLVVDVLESAGRFDTTVVSSFNPATVSRARTLGLRTGWLIAQGLPVRPVMEQAAAGKHFAVHPHVSALAGDRARSVIDGAHDAGLAVVAWTVDDPDEQRRLAVAGIDGIITNRPDRALAALENAEPSG
jgi:glycerophosphoryl diester phosphodiesterase